MCINLRVLHIALISSAMCIWNQKSTIAVLLLMTTVLQVLRAGIV